MHSFVDVTVSGRPPKSVSVESNGPKNVVTTDVGASTGTATFVYSTPAGRYRFSTRISGTRGNFTLFEMPRKVDAIVGGGGEAQKRSSVRLDTIVPGTWRPARNGRGFGDFAKGNVQDISLGGCSLILDRELPKGQQVEVSLTLKTSSEAVVTLGEIMRTSQIQTSGKYSHGVRFQGITAAQEHSIVEFINRRQADLRSRGLA